MQEVQNKEQLEFYLEKHHIRELFDTQNLPFRLYRYEVGEMMSILHPGQEYLKFIVEGSFDFYAIRADGVRNIFYHCKGFIFLGDLQFCGKDQGVRYQEVTQTVYTIELPMEPYREQLRQDVKFLNFLLDTMSTKLARTASDAGTFSDLREALLYHIRYQSPNQTITSVSQTAARLHYSLRQTQRILQELTQEGVLKRKGKGHYILTENGK